jgi:hypothetical protein
MTADQFRWTESGAAQIKLSELHKKITPACDFYSAVIVCHRQWRVWFANMPKYHKWPRYEVLEILSSETEGLYGFNVHFSNGSKATYARRDSGITATNVVFEKGGNLGFMVGFTNQIEKKWKIDGVEVVDWAKLRPDLTPEQLADKV